AHLSLSHCLTPLIHRHPFPTRRSSDLATTAWPAATISAAAPIATIFLWVPDILASSRGLHCAWEPAPRTRRTHSVRSTFFGDGGSSSVGVCHGLPVATGRRIRVSRGSVWHVGRPSNSVHLVPPVAEWEARDAVDRLRGSSLGQVKNKRYDIKCADVRTRATHFTR